MITLVCTISLTLNCCDIDQFEVDVTVTSRAAKHAWWWQKNTGNKWREMGRIHRIREYIFFVPLDVRIGMLIIFIDIVVKYAILS